MNGLMRKINPSETVTSFSSVGLILLVSFCFFPVHLPCNFHWQAFESLKQATSGETRNPFFPALPAVFTTKIP